MPQRGSQASRRISRSVFTVRLHLERKAKVQFTALLSRRSGAIVLLGALVIVLGAYLSFRIARHAEPSLVPPHLVITTLSPHTSLEDMQDRVTLPQERALNGMPGLKRLQSVTRTGTSVLVAEFAPGVDRERARLGASARVVRLPIPSDAGSVEVDWGASGLTSEQPIVLLALWSTSERADVEDLTRRAREAVLPKLLAVPQVQSAVLVGDERLQVVAELDPAKMRASGVGFDQVSALVRFNSVALATGALRSQDRSTPVLTFSEPASVQALENLVVGLAQTNPFAPPTQVRLKDLAKVSITQADGAGVLRVDRGVAVGIEVYARSSGDVLQAAAAIRRAAASINGDLEELAPDVFLETFLDRTRPTARALQGLEWLMLIGATAAVVLVSLLLLSIRAGVTVAVALGTAVGAGVIIAYLGGGALTPVSAAGFALAIAFALPPTVLSTEASWRHARSGVPSPLAPWIAVREVAP
ncbi:MAG: efflux RND transporter permease subunit, partial [SAR202 cluster bacterium]|nr:efflux RND transporter permease subunit [SAR202 cluster bacterium]